jgi:hypothetical protein
MTDAGCSKNKGGEPRKHTPITSEKQRRLFYAVAAGKKTKAKGLSVKEAKSHIKEAAGKHLVHSAIKKGTKKQKK